jgi:hypothetical protein
MKISIERLKEIIMEELEGALPGQGDDEMAQAQKLAQAFAQSPTIMAAVEQAAQDPKVQAAASGIAETALPSDDQLQTAAMGGGALAAIGTIAMAASGIPAVAALGLTAGPALMAVAILISHIVKK